VVVHVDARAARAVGEYDRVVPCIAGQVVHTVRSDLRFGTAARGDAFKRGWVEYAT